MAAYDVNGTQQEVDQIWHLRAPRDGLVGINAELAWQVTEGDGVRVVIFDTGVDYNHPSLHPNIWPALDDARDFDHSFDEEGRSPSKGGRIENKLDAHGTACAGIVGAISGDDGRGNLPPDCKVVGVAPRCTLVPVRISTNFQVAALVNALRYARKVGDIILLPRFMAESDELTNEISRVAGEIPVVCAAGNNGRRSMVYPASLAPTIAVGACNEKGYRSTYSQYGDGLDIVAPSNDVPVDDQHLIRLDVDEANRRDREELERSARMAGRPLPPVKALGLEPLVSLSRQNGWNVDRMGVLSIATTDNLGDFGYNFEPPGDYCRATGDFGFGGTSAAAAQVAGAVALMLATNPELKNRPEAVRQILHRSANRTHLQPEVPRGQPDLTHEGRPQRLREEFGHGLLDAAAAVAAARDWSAKDIP